ncbi:hypothetical protein E2C01_059419 [Portunus trituberculatus]|uniref:Uncharacterized protein n=1 Tax=Portunus trituberculatus TaxID=210409 RepID=A0A5B7H5S5_PORTR|nr:hypothetical protein [Portunus trituberculatus]
MVVVVEEVEVEEVVVVGGAPGGGSSARRQSELSEARQYLLSAVCERKCATLRPRREIRTSV